MSVTAVNVSLSSLFLPPEYGGTVVAPNGSTTISDSLSGVLTTFALHGFSTSGWQFTAAASSTPIGADAYAKTSALSSDLSATYQGLGGQCGDGSDGAGHITTNTVETKARFFTTLLVDDGVLYDTAGCPIYVNDTLTVAGTGVIHVDGAAAVGATQGAARTGVVLGGGAAGGAGGHSGAGGAGGASNPSIAAANGGAGGAGTGGHSGGAGGVVTAPTAANGPLRAMPFAMMGRMVGDGPFTKLLGGAGGGGGGDDTSDAHDGGGGGGGAGVLAICAKHIVLGARGQIHANGGAGAAGVGGNAGSGGGGTGGTVVVAYLTCDTPANITALGGAGGAAVGTGVAGGAGGAGVVVTIPL